MSTFESTRPFDCDPQQLIAALTEIDAIERWTPVPFHIADGADRLRAGDRVRVDGGLLGRTVRFDVQVHTANASGLSLRASGPFEIAVDYCIDSERRRLRARIQTRARRPLGQVLASAANAILGAGALEQALARLIREADADNSKAMCLAA